MARHRRQYSGVVGGHAPAGFLFGNAKLDGRGRETLGDQFFDGVLHDPAREFRRRVVDAELFALGRLGHRGVSARLFGVAEQRPPP